MTERTGDSELIFTYNGQYGVLTDPNGLLYMRTRFYNLQLKRFMNADIIDGSIADSTSLNLYTFVNGNPISFVDPFGLSKDDRQNGNNSANNEAEFINQIAKDQNVSFEHARIIYYSQQWTGHAEIKWTTWDIMNWKTFGGNDFLFSKKGSFVQNYKDVIEDAALKYDIPMFLLAGIMYTEFGGDPMWIDNVAYGVRSFDWCGPNWVDEHFTITKNPDLTSFGNTSIQVRRALEMLDYSSSAEQKSSVIKSLKDPVQNIYMAAKHLDVLRNVDFPGKIASTLTDEEIQIIASRYNLGPDCSLEIAKDWGYGKAIFNRAEDIWEALR